MALVTGSGKRRVGNAIAAALAARGYAIALHYNRSAEEAQASLADLRAQGVRAEAFQADVADEAAVVRHVRPGAWNASAGSTSWSRRPPSGSAGRWKKSRRPTSGGSSTSTPWARSSAAGRPGGSWPGSPRAARSSPSAIGPAGGRIATIAAYFISKGAIPTMTRMLAVELARRNPRDPRELHPARSGDAARRPLRTPEVQGRRGRHVAEAARPPEHVAQAVVFLVENDYVTGVCLPVDGGRTIGEGE